jgi:hypothetical protein
MKLHEELGLTPEEMADRNPDKLRKIEKMVSDNEWKEVRLKELKKDDYFRITFLDDDLENAGMTYSYIAITDAFVNENYKWAIEASVKHTLSAGE